jgi:hypothetical protein
VQVRVMHREGTIIAVAGPLSASLEVHG